MAGVTGTNGKTTTAFLVREILEAAGIQSGLMGTVKQLVGGEEEAVERTTPEAIDLQAAFRRMVDGGDGACVMEVSSHAMVCTAPTRSTSRSAVFTNLTQDHLDFHEDMEDYFAAKRLLFAGRARHARWSTSTTHTASGWPPNSRRSPTPPRAPRPTTPLAKWTSTLAGAEFMVESRTAAT